MKETPSVEFVLRGKVGGVDISPRTIGLSQFNEFNVQVETFVSGSQRLKLDEAHVEIREGSYVLRVLLPAVVLASLEPDLRLLAREDVLGELDFKRAEVLQKWQTRAKDDPGLSYEVRPRGDSLPRVRISHQTDYRIGEIVPWVAVEKVPFRASGGHGGRAKGQYSPEAGAQRQGSHHRDFAGLPARPGGEPALSQGAAPGPR